MEQLEGAGKAARISGFKDSSISTSKPVIDLVDAIKPGAIDYTLVLDGASEEVIFYICNTNTIGFVIHFERDQPNFRS